MRKRRRKRRKKRKRRKNGKRRRRRNKKSQPSFGLKSVSAFSPEEKKSWTWQLRQTPFQNWTCQEEKKIYKCTIPHNPRTKKYVNQPHFIASKQCLKMSITLASFSYLNFRYLTEAQVLGSLSSSNLQFSHNWRGLPWWLSGKNSTCHTGDVESVPGSGRSRREGHGNPLRCSCLENPHGQRSLMAYSPWGHKELGMRLSRHSMAHNWRGWMLFPIKSWFPFILFFAFT